MSRDDIDATRRSEKSKSFVARKQLELFDVDHTFHSPSSSLIIRQCCNKSPLRSLNQKQGIHAMSAYRPISQSPPSLSPRSSPPHSPTASLRALELSESFPDDPTHQPALKRHHRSDTVTSIGGFEFRANLLPLTLSGEGEDGGVHDGKADERHVSMLHGMSGHPT